MSMLDILLIAATSACAFSLAAMLVFKFHFIQPWHKREAEQHECKSRELDRAKMESDSIVAEWLSESKLLAGGNPHER